MERETIQTPMCTLQFVGSVVREIWKWQSVERIDLRDAAKEQFREVLRWVSMARKDMSVLFVISAAQPVIFSFLGFV